MINSMDIQNGARAYVMTGNEKYVSQVNGSRDSVNSHLLELRLLMDEYPEQHNYVDSLVWYVQ